MSLCLFSQCNYAEKFIFLRLFNIKSGVFLTKHDGLSAYTTFCV